METYIGIAVGAIVLAGVLAGAAVILVRVDRKPDTYRRARHWGAGTGAATGGASYGGAGFELSDGGGDGAGCGGGGGGGGCGGGS